ncbi:TNF receptor-associated factor 4-like [Acropora muricata]|uniref:TNF receptor-associated factor 4-like n=1 Tax=Acropora millepora TaxID=45264 RepID=UPI0010FC71FF|nr:TNF receptor-associated factor 4-like [Acropora millepora]
MPDIAGSSQSVKTVMEDAGVRATVSQNGFKTPSEEENNMTGGNHSPTGSARSRGSSSRGSPTLSYQEREKFDLKLFLYPLEKKYQCPICENVLRYPKQLKCGHRLCSSCFHELARVEPRCPLDQTEIDKDDPNQRPDHFDKACYGEILALEVRCKHHEWGCKWESDYKDFQDHVNNKCEYAEILCQNDCGAKFQKRFLQKHLDKDCPKKIIACPYCDDRHLREDKKTHLAEECPKLPLPCPNKCDKKLEIPRDELDQHIEEFCPKTKMVCEFEVIGCTHRCSREKMPKHYKSAMIDHVKAIFIKMTEQDERLNKHELALKENTDFIKGVDKRVGDLEKIANSQLIWRIEDYTRKLKEARAGNADTLFSPTFTTSKHGYRLCASVCLNGDGKGKGTHMSVFISVLKGAFDSLLKWPFDYRVTFYLLDQDEDHLQRKHIKFSIKPNPCPENEPFLGRPKLEKNASFGGAKFAKHEEIDTRHYVKDDTIFLKIAIDCDGLSEP